MEFITLSVYAKDITGQRFGRLVALGPAGRAKNRHVEWLCQCDCGNTTTAQVSNLSRGKTKSCGCLQGNRRISHPINHGLSRSRTYRIWGSMVHRCTNPNHKHYMKYGGRGVAVCDEWLHAPKAFHDYVSMLPNYDLPNRTLDRINNDGNYEPGNVRWATQTEQNRNTRTNRMITYNGKTMCVNAWNEELNMGRNVLSRRLNLGWSIERAFTEPIQPRRKPVDG